MKTNIVFVCILCLSFAMLSCDKNDSVPVDQAAAASDETLTEFALLATLSSSNARTYNSPDSTSGGKKCHLVETEVSALPETITSYITTTYADATVEHAGVTDQGEVMVHIKKSDGTNAVLLFDASGNFVSEKTHKRGHGYELGNPVAIADLPESVTSYISGNYSEAILEKAIMDEEGNYVVLVKKTDGTLVGVAFDSTGNFVNELTMKGKFGGKGHGKKH